MKNPDFFRSTIERIKYDSCNEPRIVLMLFFAILSSVNAQHSFAHGQDRPIASRAPTAARKIAAEMQVSFYQGDLKQLKARRSELEKLAENETEKTVKANLHYYSGLGWRHQAWLVPGNEKNDCYNSALKHFELSIELNPNNAAGHALASHCYRSMIGLGQRDHDTIQSAIAHREKAYELGPTDPRVLALEAYALIAIPEGRGGDIKEGLSVGFEAIGRFSIAEPDPADIGIAFDWYIVGIGFQKAKDNANAIAAFKRALEIQPDWSSANELIAGLTKQMETKAEGSSGQ